MKIAIPVAGNVLCAHFGHCENFALFEVDEASKKVSSRMDLPAPPHEPGVFPKWLGEQNVTVVIAGGLGGRARDLLSQQGIDVVVGAPSGDPAAVAQAYLDGELSTSPNFCEK